MEKQLFGIVSTKASQRFTPVAVKSFFRYTPLTLGDKLVVIDNDGTLDHRQLPVTSATFEIRTNGSPRGFAENFNTLIKEAVSSGADLYVLNNDVVFVQDWIQPLQVGPLTISTSLSNREIAYVTSVANMRGEIKDAMVVDSTLSLEAYIESPQAFDYVAAIHRKHGDVQIPTYFVPFFCTRIPHQILQIVGELDASIGPAGGEDFDYCVRTYLAGFNIIFAAQSYVLHFGGQSTWNGAEDSSARAKREEQFKEVFKTKWGDRLFALAFDPEHSAVFTDAEIIRLDREKKLGDVIRTLAPAIFPPKP